MAKTTDQEPKVIAASMPPGTPAASRLGKDKRTRVLALTLLAVVVIAAGIILWTHHSANKIPVDKNGVPIQQQSFSKTKVFTLTSPAKGAGAVFNLPVEFGTAIATKVGSANFNEVTSNANYQNVPLGELSIESFVVTHPLNAAQLAYFAKTVTSTTSRQQVAKQYENYIYQKMPAGYTLTINSVKPFTSPNIKSNAWVMAVSAAPNDPKSPNLSAQEGELIYVIGDKANYYFLIMATDYNWTSSQQAIINVVNSLVLNK